MNRTNHYPRPWSLLLLLLCSVAIKAQTYSLEYWFDKYSSPKSASFSGSDFNKHIEVSFLKQGFHTMYMRVKASDGTYSPVTSSMFIKFAASPSGESVLEYWFDNDVQKMATAAIDVNSDVAQLLDLDMTDPEKFPLGVHQLNMRVAAYGGNYSPVYSALVLKLPGGTGDSVLEYWFDDGIDSRSTIPIDIASGTLQKLDLDMTNAINFPMGFHKLSMRVAAYGSQYSPVYSAYVMRLPSAQPTQIVYWLDDNYAGRRVVKGIPVNATTTVINTHLDFSNAPIGLHRFKYRVTYNGFDDGVVYEVPVLITKKYNSMGEVTIVGESHWIDDVSPMEYGISNPQTILTRSYTLNPAAYTTGQHTFHIQYKNSADVWSKPNVTYFYKDDAGILRVGRRPEAVDGINVASMDEQIVCFSEQGTIYVDCQSPRLASTGIIQVYDMKGALVAQQTANNVDGIHATIDVEGYAHQLLIVRLLSGEVLFNKKLTIK